MGTGHDSGGGISASPAAQQMFQEASEFFARGDTERAAEIAAALTKQHPERPNGFALLARCMMKLERWPEAVEAAARAAALKPDDEGLRQRYLHCAALEQFDQAQTLARAGNFRAALQALDEIAVSEKMAARVEGLRRRLLVHVERADEALRNAQSPEEPVAETPGKVATARALLKAGKATEARDLLAGMSAEKAGAPYWAALSDVERALGYLDAADTAIDRAIALDPDSPILAARKVSLLQAKGKPDEAEERVIAALARAPDSVPLLVLCTNIHSLRARWNEAAKLAERVCAIEPEEPSHRCRWAEILLDAQRPAEALAAVGAAETKAIEKPELAVRFAMARAQAHEMLGDAQAAVEDYRDALTRSPDHERALERLAALYQAQGLAAEVRPLLARLKSLRGGKLPDNVRAALAEIDAQIQVQREPTEAMRWAWSIADQGKWTLEEWRRGVEWNRQAGALLFDWWRWRPDRRAEIASIADVRNPEVLRKAAGGRGCILASSHLGFPAVGIMAVSAMGLPFKLLGAPGTEGAAEEKDQKVIPLSGNMLGTTRKLIEHLEKGGVLGVACDTPTGETFATTFLGIDVQLPALIPKLVRQHAGASVFMRALWNGDRVTVEFELLPSPRGDEREDEWAQTWFAAYLKMLEPIFRGDPKNLTMNAGIPLNLSPDARAMSVAARKRNRSSTAP